MTSITDHQRQNLISEAAQNREAGLSVLTEADIIMLDNAMNDRVARVERKLELQKPKYEGA